MSDGALTQKCYIGCTYSSVKYMVIFDKMVALGDVWGDCSQLSNLPYTSLFCIAQYSQIC